MNRYEIQKLTAILDQAFSAPRPGLKIVTPSVLGAKDPDVIAYKAREKQARQRAERRQQIEAQQHATKLAAKFPADLRKTATAKK